jgi:hypothetical protein
MRLFRIGVAWLLVLGLTTPTFAGDLRESIANAAEQAAQQPPAKIPAATLWPGVALVGAGMFMTLYGFLHTTGGKFVSGEVSKESNEKLGGAGLALVGAGGALLFLGSQRAKTAPSVTFGAGRVGLAKRVSW